MKLITQTHTKNWSDTNRSVFIVKAVLHTIRIGFSSILQCTWTIKVCSVKHGLDSLLCSWNNLFMAPCLQPSWPRHFFVYTICIQNHVRHSGAAKVNVNCVPRDNNNHHMARVLRVERGKRSVDNFRFGGKMSILTPIVVNNAMGPLTWGSGIVLAFNSLDSVTVWELSPARHPCQSEWADSLGTPGLVASLFVDWCPLLSGC